MTILCGYPELDRFRNKAGFSCGLKPYKINSESCSSFLSRTIRGRLASHLFLSSKTDRKETRKKHKKRRTEDEANK